MDAEVNKNLLLKLEKRKNVERFKYDDLFFLSLSENTSNKDGRIYGSRNKSKYERMTEIIMSCGSPNSQIDILRQVMKGPLIFTTLELISSRSPITSTHMSNNKSKYSFKQYYDFIPKT